MQETDYSQYTCEEVNVPAVDLLGAIGAVLSGCPSSHTIFKGVVVKPLSFLRASSWMGGQKKNEYKNVKTLIINES